MLRRLKRTPSSSVKEPERVTFIERFVNAFHLPFFLGCLLLAFIIGPPGGVLLAYVQTSNMDEALARTIYLYFGEWLPVWQGVAALGLYLTFLFYCLYVIRYMRLKLVAAKPALLPLLPEGEETLQVFSPVSQLQPPIIIAAAIMIVVLLQCVPDSFPPRNFVVFCTVPANMVFLAVSYPLQFVIFGTFFWVYLSSIWGLHELGKKSLKLKSFREDKMLGARPIGLLSLSFAFTYLTGPVMLASQLIILLPNTATPLYMSLLAFLILLGVIFFFFPLNTIHKRMLEAKRREQEVVRQQFVKAVEIPNGSSTEGSESSLSEMREILNRLTKVITADVTKDEVEAIPTWPVDMAILGRLAALIVTTICVKVLVEFIVKQIFHW